MSFIVSFGLFVNPFFLFLCPAGNGQSSSYRPEESRQCLQTHHQRNAGRENHGVSYVIKNTELRAVRYYSLPSISGTPVQIPVGGTMWIGRLGCCICILPRLPPLGLRFKSFWGHYVDWTIRLVYLYLSSPSTSGIPVRIPPGALCGLDG